MDKKEGIKLIAVSEIIKSSCLKNYPVICGLDGLENEVVKSGIIDYEFSIEGFIEEHNSFQRGDFLLSSLMFTGGDDGLLLSMLRKLVELGVSGLAVKNVFFTSLPQEVIDYCNSKSFPVILFDNRVYFEEIVNDIDNLLQLSDWINKTEHQISLMLSSELPRYEIEDISREMQLNKQPYIIAFWIKPKIFYSQLQIKRIVKEYAKLDHKNGFLLKYKQDFVLLVTFDKKDSKIYQYALNEVLNRITSNSSDFTIGISDINVTTSELDFSIKQSLWSYQVAEILNENMKNYNEIGSWAVATAHYQSMHMMKYMNKYLNPIMNDISEVAKDLLETLIAMVLCEGNTKLATKRLGIHENTYRYRINKIRDKLDPNSNDFIFFENASMAIRIYLLSQYENTLR